MLGCFFSVIYSILANNIFLSISMYWIVYKLHDRKKKLQTISIFLCIFSLFCMLVRLIQFLQFINFYAEHRFDIPFGSTFTLLSWVFTLLSWALVFFLSFSMCWIVYIFDIDKNEDNI